MNVETCDLFAKLLAYPDDATKSVLDRCRGMLGAGEAANAMSRFADQIEPLPLAELQEHYVQTFDLNPKCSLEVGWQLYGENYSRGEFLVAMRQTLRRLGIDESTELPDHLTLVLPALGRMDAREASRFGGESVLPALEKMRHGLNGPYAELLASLHAEARAAYPAVPCGDDRRAGALPLPVIDPSLEVCHG